jgi:hypothetical protein
MKGQSTQQLHYFEADSYNNVMKVWVVIIMATVGMRRQCHIPEPEVWVLLAAR